MGDCIGSRSAQDQPVVVPKKSLLSGAPDIDLSGAVRAARVKLPAEHRALLKQLNAQDVIVEDWPSEVLDLFRTVLKTPPAEGDLAGALAVWLDGPRVVAFNGPLLRNALEGLEAPTVQRVMENIAWHEYGHALSVTRASDELRRNGVRLLELLPEGLRRAIDYPGAYSRRQVFDEVIANLYPLMVDRAVRLNDYGRPHYLHPNVFEAFGEVLPWPPAR